MKAVTMYFKPSCPYCYEAHELLTKKGVQYQAIDIAKFPERRDEMIQRAGGRTTVPQIFIDDQHIGGCDDLVALENGGQLDALLAD